MKILCCWNDYMASGATYETVNIQPALVALGHSVTIFPLMNENISKTMRPLDYELLSVVKLTKPDLLIFLEYKGAISPEVIRSITMTDVTTLFISGDEEKYFSRTKEYSPFVDNMFTTFKPAVEKHKKLGCPNVIFGGYYANDKIYKNYKLKKSIDVSFAGARTEPRRILFNKITMKGVDLTVYGNGWEGKPLELKDYILLMNKSKINLNVSVDIVNGKNILQVKGRDFEVPMCGGFLLTQENEDLENFYKQGKEVAVYKDNDEAIDKIKYYLKHDSERKKIAKAGYERAHKEHTSLKRWKYILKNCVYKRGS